MRIPGPDELGREPRGACLRCLRLAVLPGASPTASARTAGMSIWSAPAPPNGGAGLDCGLSGHGFKGTCEFVMSVA